MGTPNILSWDLETTNLNADFGYILCGGIKKFGSDKVDMYRIDNYKKFDEDPTNDRALVLALKERLSEADLWVTWYGGKFDVPFLNSRLLYHHIAPMPPVPHMDCWRVCREKLKIHSNRLASASAFLGLPSKTAVDGPIWVRAMSGHKPSLKYIVDHCLTPDHKILMADLQYKELANIGVGDSILAFDENGPNRKYHKAVVERVSFAKDYVYEVRLSSGKIFKVTRFHKWLVSSGNTYKWLTTCQLRSDGIMASKINQVFPMWDTNKTYEAGYLAGVLDGEGYVSQSVSDLGSHSLSVGFSQRPNECLAEALYCLDKFKEYTLNPISHVNQTGLGKGDCQNVLIRGCKPELLGLLGAIRPARLLANLDLEKLGRMERRFDNKEEVVAVIPIGKMEVARVQTSTGTMIVDGYPHHNCRQDVVVLEMAYEKLRTLTTTRPNVAIMADLPNGCPICYAPATKLQRRGKTVKKTGSARRYQCQECGGWSHGPDQRIKGLEAR